MRIIMYDIIKTFHIWIIIHDNRENTKLAAASRSFYNLVIGLSGLPFNFINNLNWKFVVFMPGKMLNFPAS